MKFEDFKPGNWGDLSREEVAKICWDAGEKYGRRAARLPTIKECESAGRGPVQTSNTTEKYFSEGGLPNTSEERARFEAYMRGHCWDISEYDEIKNCYDTVLVRMLYGVWRDRGLLPTLFSDEKRK